MCVCVCVCVCVPVAEVFFCNYMVHQPVRLLSVYRASFLSLAPLS